MSVRCPSVRPVSVHVRAPKWTWPGSRDRLNFWALNGCVVLFTGESLSYNHGLVHRLNSPVNKTTQGMLIAQKRLKLRTSNLTCMFQELSRHDRLKCFRKGALPGLRHPLIFWALNANSSKTVKAMDFKDSPDMIPKSYGLQI